MIQIKTQKLAGRRFEAWKERAAKARQKLLDEWKATGQPPTEFNPQIWRTLKEEFLLEIHTSKCAYFEGKIVGLADLHVEHYRPKGMVTVRTDELDQKTRQIINHPGYFWLAYEWYNLILSCPYCNTSHATENQKKRIKHPGKLNEFRITGQRVNQPCKDPEKWFEELQDEDPLLLHPYFDKPEEHIAFDDNGVPYPKKGSQKGRETIIVCNLEREELNQARRRARDCNLHQALNNLFEGREIGDTLDGAFSLWLTQCVKSYVQKMNETFPTDE